MNLPKYTAEIFDVLSKGQFLCANSSDDKIRRLFDATEEHFDELENYFAHINFILEKGDGYYYLSRVEGKADLERKTEAAFKWIDILDFLKTFDNAFGPGYRFTPSDFLVKLNVDAVLKNKLESLKKYSKEDNFDDSIRKIIKMLADNNFLEEENPILSSWKVLSSFKYLEELIIAIHIPEEVQNEIPE